MLLTVGTTEAVEAIAEAQENLQEVAKNPGILRTYFQNLVPDLLNFALQVVIAVIVYAVGAKLIGLIVKIVRKTMERRNADVGVIQFLSAVVKYALYFILILTILSLFGIELPQRWQCSVPVVWRLVLHCREVSPTLQAEC